MNSTTKLPDASLRDFVSSESQEAVTVIVEVDVPPTAVRFDPVTRRPLAFSAVAGAEARVNEVKNALSEIVSRDAQYLSAAKAFVLDVLPSQLRAIVELPYVRAVRENRTLYRSG